ncbi:MAG: hypothetical protein IH934_04265 [Nanoarchaeota archaeon]|nr:hypothetical protein [Nanoarchaeota archaeon]
MTIENEPLRFRVGMKYIDIETLVELDSDRGMVFHDEYQQEEFFRRAEQDPSTVPYWAAVSHAKGTNLGIWGDDDGLYDDCAKIMEAELKRAETEHGLHFSITKDEIKRSEAFHEAYGFFRKPKEDSIHNLVRSLGYNQEHMDRQDTSVDLDILRGFQTLHTQIVRELRGHLLPQQEHYRLDPGNY